MSSGNDHLIKPNPADPRLTERVRGVDQTGAPVETFREVFTGATIVPDRTATGRSINVATLFDTFPVALLVPDVVAAGSVSP